MNQITRASQRVREARRVMEHAETSRNSNMTGSDAYSEAYASYLLALENYFFTCERINNRDPLLDRIE